MEISTKTVTVEGGHLQQGPAPPAGGHRKGFTPPRDGHREGPCHQPTATARGPRQPTATARGPRQPAATVKRGPCTKTKMATARRGPHRKTLPPNQIRLRGPSNRVRMTASSNPKGKQRNPKSAPLRRKARTARQMNIEAQKANMGSPNKRSR